MVGRVFIKFLTRIPRARSASPRSGCPSRGETQRRVTAAQAGLAIRSEPSRANASAESAQRGFSRVEYANG